MGGYLNNCLHVYPICTLGNKDEVKILLKNN